MREGESVKNSKAADQIILYDGVCGVCHRVVQILLKIDRSGVFMFAPLQGDTAAALRAAHPEIPADIDTAVFIDGGRVHLRSKAVLMAAAHLPWPWRAGYWLRWIPAPIGDLLYRAVAAVRYRIFGQVDACTLPSPQERARFLP